MFGRTGYFSSLKPLNGDIIQLFKNIDRLFRTGLHNIKPGLDRISGLLETIDSPHRKVSYVLVGGTNGKCSVATAIASVLEENSYKTGLYTSPHLVSVTERFRINGAEITEQRLDDILGFVFKKCEHAGIELSYFELVTVAAFIYFNEERIDIGVLEVGMGGRWDATNVCSPLVSVITNVSLDHTAYLGDTSTDIAHEKAELLREHGLAVTGAADEPLEVIKKVSKTISCHLFILGQDFYASNISLSSFDYHGINNDIFNINFTLSGIHQVKNLCISIGCVELLKEYFNYRISSEKIISALQHLKIEGRFEYLRYEPPVIMDGAHNESAAAELIRTLDSIYGNLKFVFLISMLSDKDHISYIRKIVTKASKLVITQLPEERCEKADVLYRKISSLFDNIEVIEDPVYALKKVLYSGHPVCITGSFYLLGYLKERIKNDKNSFGI